MRILVTNNHLKGLGGTETWVITMVRELAKQHEVGVFTHHKGYVADLLKDYIDDNPKGYDLAIINHNTCINVDAKFKIFTSHGTEPELEKPLEGCDKYVAVNENVAEKYNLKYIIKNPIDTVLFSPTSEINDTPERILDLTTNQYPYKATKPSRDTYDMPELINQHDLVISVGRGALEAMSCARNVIVWDKKYGWEARGDGYMNNPESIKGYVAGEYAKWSIDWQSELDKYKKSDGLKNREYILKHHDVTIIAKEYLNG